MSLASYPLIPPVVSVLNSTLVAEVMLYGVHAVLFCLSVYVLITDRHPSFWIHISCAVAMFALSTADIGISIRLFVHDMPFFPPNIFGTIMFVQRIRPKGFIFVVNNLIADFTLLYRSYMIWNRSKYILLAVGLLVLGDTILGFVSLGARFKSNALVPYYWGTIFGLNVLITLVTVGRILWVSQLGLSVMSGRKRRHYYKITAILVETSLIYSCIVLGAIIIKPNNPLKLMFACLSFRVVAIMPTLLLAQVGLSNITRDHGDNSHSRTGLTTARVDHTRHSDEAASRIMLDTLTGTTPTRASFGFQRRSIGTGLVVEAKHQSPDASRQAMSRRSEHGDRLKDVPLSPSDDRLTVRGVKIPPLLSSSSSRSPSPTPS